MTDLDEMERRIRGIFGRAGKELKAKWDDWMKDMDKELEGLQKAYEAAKASGDGAAIRKAGIALSRAKKDKIMGNKYYDQMVAQSAERLNEAQQQAMAYINGQMPMVYATSFNGSTAQIADGVPGRMGISFDLADESTVARLMRDPSMDLHDLTRSVSGTKMAAWNNRAISSEITQGIVQGDSIPRIAGRLMNVAGMDMKAATRTARTMTTGAENAGREDSYHRAQDMGIKMKQKWVATLDGNTRHSHRQLDGEIREVGEPFSNGLRFPGDPYGPPEEVYNCRCTLIAVLDGFDRDKVKRWDRLEDQSYEEWKAGGSGKKQNNETEKANEEKKSTIESINEIDERLASLHTESEKAQDEYQELFGQSILSYGSADYDRINAELEKAQARSEEIYNEINNAMLEKERLLRTKAEDEIARAFGQIEGPHNIDVDASKVNQITADPRSQTNCGYCSLAYDARRRGIDCSAMYANGTNNNQIEQWWDGLTMTPTTRYSPSSAIDEIMSYAENCGVGTRGIVQIDTSATSGHYIMFEVGNDGKCVFVDPQTGAVGAGAQQIFDIARPGGIMFARTDDKELTLSAMLSLNKGW